MTALAARVDDWNHAYRVEGRSPVDDALYDQAVRRLGEWRSCFPAQAPGVPPQLAAAGGATLAPVVQTGLDKLDDTAALDAWLRARDASELWANPRCACTPRACMPPAYLAFRSVDGKPSGLPAAIMGSHESACDRNHYRSLFRGARPRR